MEFLESIDYATWVWLIILLATLALEIMTVDLVSIWFSVGALFALILSVFGIHVGFQVAAFIVVSIVLLATVGRWSRRMVKDRVIATNVDSLVGQPIVILKDANDLEYGEGKIRGVIWRVICERGQTVKAGDIATVLRIDGNKLFVKKTETKN